MLYLYAIEPDVFLTWDKCRATINLMGFRHGRAIVAYPSNKRWKRMIFEACTRNPSCGEREFERIYEKIQESEDKLVSAQKPIRYDGSITPPEECWIRNATAHQDGTGTFHAILSTRNPTSHHDVVLEEDVDESHVKLAVRREQPVLRQAQPLAGHIATLVVNSREMLLVDPHLDLSKDKWRSVIAACLDLAGRSMRDDPRAEIHTSDSDTKWSTEEFRKQCRQYLPGMMAGKLTSIRVRRWRLRDNEPHDFHARYVLTDRGGYRLDKGLDEQPGVEQPVGLLDDQEWNRVRKGYGDANPFLERADTFTLDKSVNLRLELQRDEPVKRTVTITRAGRSPNRP